MWSVLDVRVRWVFEVDCTFTFFFFFCFLVAVVVGGGDNEDEIPKLSTPGLNTMVHRGFKSSRLGLKFGYIRLILKPQP